MLKKLLYILVCLLSISNAIAQRQVDLSCEAVLKPDTVFTYQTTYCSMIAKNNGPDTLYADDTIAYRFRMPGNGFNDIYFPPTDAYYRCIGKTMLPGDTVFIDTIIPSVIVKKTDYNEFLGIVDIYNRKDTTNLIEERPSKYANNSKQIFIWYMGDNVNTNFTSDTPLKIYPTVTERTICIESIVPITLITVQDVNGKVIKKINHIENNLHVLAMNELPSGVYYLTTVINSQNFYNKIIKL